MDALTNQVGAADVGPTNAYGWTAAWLDLRPGEHPLDFLPPPYLAIEDTAIGDICAKGIARALSIHTKFTAPKHLRWHNAAIGSHSSHPHLIANAHDIAEQLYVLLGPADQAGTMTDRDITDAVARALGRDQHLRELINRLAELLQLPASSPEHPPVAAIAVRSKLAIARATAERAGPTRILPGQDQIKWTTMTPHRPELDRSRPGSPAEADRDGTRLLAMATTSIRRRDVVVALWRNGPACGWELWQRGKQIAGGTWNTGWRDLYVTENSEATYRVLCAALDTPADPVEARDLLGTRDRVFDPLPDFVEQFGLPSELLLALDRPTMFGRCAELVGASSLAVDGATPLGLGDLVSAVPQAELAAVGGEARPAGGAGGRSDVGGNSAARVGSDVGGYDTAGSERPARAEDQGQPAGAEDGPGSRSMPEFGATADFTENSTADLTKDETSDTQGAESAPAANQPPAEPATSLSPPGTESTRLEPPGPEPERAEPTGAAPASSATRFVKRGAAIPLRAARILGTIIVFALLALSVVNLVLGHIDGTITAFEHVATLALALVAIVDVVATLRIRRRVVATQVPIAAESSS